MNFDSICRNVDNNYDMCENEEFFIILIVDFYSNSIECNPPRNHQDT
jgi:hypothetical protein